MLSWWLEHNEHTLKHIFNATFKSHSRRELDTALLHGRAQQEAFPFQSFSSHNSTVNKKLSLQQLICKGKQKPETLWACPGKRPPEEILGRCIQHPVHKGKKKSPETGQKVLKQLSTEILINLGLCCRTGSWKAWQKSNAATGIEVNMKRERGLHYEHSHGFPASPAHIPRYRFYMDSLCSRTTPQQLFSHKPPSRHGNANNCRLASEKLALVTCKTRKSIMKMAKEGNIMDPCLHIINNFFPRNIYSYALLHTDCNWAAILRAVRISHIRTPKLSHFMPKKGMKTKI